LFRTIEAIIESDGTVRLLESIQLGAAHRALITILGEPDDDNPSLPSVLSERALAEDWNRPEEEEAWDHLQPER
jgi:hypothetical protein